MKNEFTNESQCHIRKFVLIRYSLVQSLDKYTQYHTSALPVISFGFSMPMIFKMVGARSQSFPFATTFVSLSSKNKGTGLVVWAVLGVPSSLIMKSALPWSAV